MRSCTVSAETGLTLFYCFTAKSDSVRCKNQLHKPQEDGFAPPLPTWPFPSWLCRLYP